MIYHFPLAARIAIGLGVGLAAGAIHFATLRWNVRLLIAGTPVKAIGLQLLRLAGVAILFGILAKLGAWPLLCGAAGLLLARSVILRRVQVTP
ncbi:N-ATPase, AtpR subunit [Caballeronia udeis]|uniref:N-ATPase, AtpR subunit n=1 Tax=Caballeronia udeis TaxID=1232866 RepID=A0A158GE69_9BURK|nr:ATP synthase subunit I [Caballeronia udeis]SAL30207.1 N-ATPase, AtpR subunit [Caballeronia udeis]